MTGSSVLTPHPPEFERFLYASVGEDRNGFVVTVLSTLARLELDPWAETASLVSLSGEAARSRLDLLLSGFRDVPALKQDHEDVARDLSKLLPGRPARIGASLPDPAAQVSALGSTGVIWLILTLVLFLGQALMISLGVGE